MYNICNLTISSISYRFLTKWMPVWDIFVYCVFLWMREKKIININLRLKMANSQSEFASKNVGEWDGWLARELCKGASLYIITFCTYTDIKEGFQYTHKYRLRL